MDRPGPTIRQGIRQFRIPLQHVASRLAHARVVRRMADVCMFPTSRIPYKFGRFFVYTDREDAPTPIRLPRASKSTKPKQRIVRITRLTCTNTALRVRIANVGSRHPAIVAAHGNIQGYRTRVRRFKRDRNLQDLTAVYGLLHAVVSVRYVIPAPPLAARLPPSPGVRAPWLGGIRVPPAGLLRACRLVQHPEPVGTVRVRTPSPAPAATP
jgi:hypothetical protein